MNSNKQQTAVELFIEQLEAQGESWENVSIGRIQISIKVEDYLKLIDQAKEMEKQQMRLADKNGQDRNQYKHDCKYGGVEYWDNEPKSFEQYYNETFNK